MQPLGQSYCARAFNYRLRRRHNPTCIPECALSRAFERCCSVSQVALRSGSCTPGPLESRRRLGKRKMGAITLDHSHTKPAVWEIAQAYDLTKWKWHPPWQLTAKNDRHEGVSSEVDRDLEYKPEHSFWDAMSVLVSPLSPGDQAEPASSAESPNILVENPAGFWAVNRGALVHLFRDVTANALALDDLRFSWQHNLESGVMTTENISTVFQAIIQTTERCCGDQTHPLNSLMADKFRLRFLTATTDSFSLSISKSPALDKPQTWLLLLHELSKIGLDSERLFEHILSQVPVDQLGLVVPGIVSNLNALCQRSNTGTRKINKMARCLSKTPLDESVMRSILKTMGRNLIIYSKSRNEHFAAVRFRWLSILARLPRLSYRAICKVCRQLDVLWACLTSREICELYVARLRSCHPRTPLNMEYVYDQLRKSDETRALESLSFAFWRKQKPNYIWGLRAFLRDLGRYHDADVLVYGLVQNMTNQSTPLAHVAWSMGKPSLALDVALEYAQSRNRDKNFWRTDQAIDVLATLTNLRDLKPSRFLKALSIYSHVSPIRVRQKDSVLRAELGAKALAYAPFISSRQAFHSIAVCIMYLQRNFLPPGEERVVRITPTIMRALLYVVTRDLAEGKPGRTTRLRWFLRLVETEVGTETATRNAEAFREWRRRLPRQDRRRRIKWLNVV